MGGNNRSPATAYPVATGHPVATDYPNPHSPETDSLRCLLLCSSFVFLLIVLNMISWFLVQPCLPEFSVSSVSVSNFNISTSPSLITGNWDVHLSARNPDISISVHYDNIKTFLFYKDILISQTTLQPFVLGYNQTTVWATLASRNAYVGRGVVDDISKDMRSGSVRFNLKLSALRFEVNEYWSTNSRSLRVYCEGLELGLTAAAGNASLVDQEARQCKVRLEKMFDIEV